jgi:hypothetical protein
VPFDSTTIDRIVAGVLTQLGGETSRAAEQGTTETRRHGEALKVERSALRQIEFTERVITAALVAELPEQTGAVIVDAKAIVTPAAWDVAKLRGLHIDRKTTGIAGTAPKHSTLNPQYSTPPLLIIVHHTDAVARLWDDLQSGWKREFLGCPDDAARLAIAEISRGGVSQVVILAEQTHRAACLANRHEAVKAVGIRDIADVQATKTQLRTNVWCLSPKDKSWFELRRLFSSFVPKP